MSLATRDGLVVALHARPRRRPGRRIPPVDAHVRRDAVDTSRSTHVPSRSPPAATLAPLATASSISALTRSTASALTSAPSTTLPSRGSPTVSDRPSRRASHELVGDLFVDDDALGRHADLALVAEAPKAAASRPRRGRRRRGSPAAPCRRARAARASGACRAVSAMMRPTRVEPVKLTRRTAGCAISASTTAGASAGALVTTLTTPGGKPASAQHVADQAVRAPGTSRRP